jgi:hypothetical protein
VNLPRGRSASINVERELAAIERRLRAELKRELDERMLAYRRYVDRELGAVNDRIDGALARSLRALNAPTERR